VIFAIARKEFVDAWRDGRFRLGAFVMVILLATSTLLAWRQTERTTHERAAATALERENWLGQGQKNSHSAGHYGVNVFKPVAPLSLFDRGIEPFVGTTLFLEAHRQNQAAFAPAQDATAMRRFGELTGAVGLQLLAPLLIILLAFGSVAGERERGTLRQVLSLGVSPRALVFGKTIGLGAALACLFVPAFLLLFGALSSAEWVSTADVGARLGWLALVYGVYLSTVLFVSILVSTLAPSGKSALAILLAMWAAGSVIAPRLASDVVHASMPLIALADFENEMNEDLQKGLDGHDPRSKRMEEFTQRVLRENGKARVEDLPFNFRGLAMLESERLAGEVFDHHFGRLWDRIDAQDRAVTFGGALAPMIALRTVSMGLAGTDFGRHRHFAVAAENHRREFVRVLNEDVMKNASPENQAYAAGRELWEQLPVFALDDVGLERVLERARLAIWILIGWFIASGMALFWAANRMKASAA